MSLTTASNNVTTVPSVENNEMKRDKTVGCLLLSELLFGYLIAKRSRSESYLFFYAWGYSLKINGILKIRACIVNFYGIIRFRSPIALSVCQEIICGGHWIDYYKFEKWESGYIEVELYNCRKIAMRFSRNYPSPLKHPPTKKMGGIQREWRFGTLAGINYPDRKSVV